MRIGVALLMLAAALAAAPFDEKGFEKGLKRIRVLAKHKKWEKARTTLLELLEDHKERGYAYARLPQLRELASEIAFRSWYPDADPKDLVSGELIKYEPRTGKIKIRYVAGTMSDWTRAIGLRVFPAPFSGPHTVRIRGDKYPSGGVSLLACLNARSGILMKTGTKPRWAGGGAFRATMWRLRNGKRGDEEWFKPPDIHGDKPFDMRMVVTRSRVKLYNKGVVFFEATKDAGDWGNLGVGNLESFDEIVLSGTLERNWMQGLIDAKNQERRDEFKKRYREKDHLPAWLLTPRGNKSSGGKVAKHDDWPVPLTGESKTMANAIRLMLGAGKVKEAQDAITIAIYLPKPVRMFLNAEAHRRLGRYRKALAAYEAVHQDYPDFLDAIEGAAAMHAMLRDDAKTESVYRDLLSRYPDDPALHSNWALILMRLGRLTDADALVKDAIARGVQSDTLRFVARLLQMSRQGPSFQRRFEVKTRHYHIVSDIDRAVCSEAGVYLEQMYARFVNRLSRPKKNEGDRRFKVYLFSGQATYLAYFKDLTTGDARGSAGLYHPLLKQLLIWNHSRKSDMMETVRHEGFHQYLDRVLPNAPRWFNEGLAVYYERAKASGGELRVGQFRRDSQVILEKLGIVPLADFFRLDDATFMKAAHLHYAQSWAIIHLLLQTDRDHKQMFKKLWASYRDNPDHEEALAAVFSDAAITVLENELRELIDKKR